KAVPTFDTDEDVLCVEARKRCPRIDEAAEPIYDSSGALVGETPIVDPKAKEAGLPDGTIIDPAIIEDVMGLLVVVEREVDDEPPTDEESEKPPASTTEKQPKKKGKITMMHAEWLLGESAELGQAKEAEELKNS